jgi:two-component sensor histidine kinase/putative methionine-R-sulfoxide reductase with GAF domain
MVVWQEGAFQMARDIESLLRQQAALAAFGSFAFQETDLNKILAEAARICAESLGVAHCKVCRYRVAENDLLIEAGFGWKPGVVGRVVSPADESSPQGRAFVTGQPVIVHHLQEANDYQPPDFYADHQIVSTVDVVIKAHTGVVFGVLEVDSTEPHVYDEHDIDFLTGFANVLAEAVATRTRNEELQAALASMTAAVAEKERLLAERNLMATELQHRVRNNLQLIHDIVTAQLRQTMDDEGRSGLRGIIRRIMSLAEVYEHLLGIGMNGQIDFRAYAIGLCANLPDLHQVPVLPIVLGCDGDTLTVPLVSATALGLVLTELISNSYEHAFPDQGGRIDVHMMRGEGADRGVITISDDGIGYVAVAETQRQGVGLARRLMQQVKGTLEVSGGAGTVWTLRFPVVPNEPLAAAVA